MHIEPFTTIRQQSGAYPVFVGPGLIDRVGDLVQPRGSVFVITSHALRDRFGDRVAASFGGHAGVIAIEEGESRKTLETAEHIVTVLLGRKAKRDSMAVVVGGGMLGDTAGFAASIFLRGIDLVHVPTTLLAQVDSSIGGKVAVNHPLGKNLIGSFRPPRAVVADVDTLGSLPDRELLSGMFEALKGGIIADPLLFAMFETMTIDLEEMVRRAILVKAGVVSADERESGLRRLLNYGHTIAHGIEAAMNYEGMTHGEAVAWGMIGANAIAVRRGLLEAVVANRIARTIRSLSPAPIPRSISEDAVLAATDHDKKNTGTSRVMVLPRDIGHCEAVADITDEEIVYGISTVLG